MTKEEFEALVAKVGEETAIKIKSEMEKAQKDLDLKIAAATKDKATKEDVSALIAEALKAANEAYMKIMKEQGEALGELKLQIKSTDNSGKKLTIDESIAKAFEDMSEDVRKEWDTMVKTNKQKGPFFITIDKSAITMGEDNTIGSGDTEVLLTENTGIISPIRKRLEKYLGKVSTGSINSARALWVEETDQQGTPIFIGEGDSKIQISSKWVEKTESVKKIGVFAKVTTELLQDLSQLVAYIKNSLTKRLSLATEDQLFSGDGTGDNLKGAKTLATAFSSGALAAAVEAPNEFDVLTAIALQVKIANGVPNGIFINPSTWAIMQTLKDEQHRPIWKDYLMPGGVVVFAGMEIIETTAIDAGDFIGGDLSVLNVLFREQMTLQIGLDGNDFTNNKKTILAESRLVQFASANDTPCLVKGAFATAKAALSIANP